MEFFSKAKEQNWLCEEILTEKFAVSVVPSERDSQVLTVRSQPMFPEDSGAEEVRATVHGWRLTRATQA